MSFKHANRKTGTANLKFPPNKAATVKMEEVRVPFGTRNLSMFMVTRISGTQAAEIAASSYSPMPLRVQRLRFGLQPQRSRDQRESASRCVRGARC